MKRVLIIFLVVICAASAWFLQRERPSAAPRQTQVELIIAGLGGFRGIVAEVIWFRAERLQDEGRYTELAQLGTWLTMLEPHTPEVWAYTAWNLSYNISVMMPLPADRWRWVKSGIELLRDEGLRLNPDDPAICRELAWLFLAKLAGRLDSAASFYCAEWARLVNECRAANDFSPLKMTPKLMEQAQQNYGPLDWQNPIASALYWAQLGLQRARGATRIELRQVEYQALMQLTATDVKWAPRALRALNDARREFPSDMIDKLIEGFTKRYRL